MSNTVSGGCRCGQVRYLAVVEPVVCFVSYRPDCVRQAGGPCVVYLALEAGDLAISGNSLAVYIDESGAGERVRRHFCRACGSAILARFDRMADLVCVTAGTLDDPRWVRPTAQTGAEHRLPWAYPPTELSSLEGALATR